MQRIFSFPETVNEVAARTVATGVVAMALAVLLLRQYWVLVLLAYGFLARVAAGPRFSPLALLATRIVAPRLPKYEKMVPGPPKRFAQAIGAVFATSALIAHFGFGATPVALALMAGLAAAAFLEAAFGFCLGCSIFGALMKANLIPERVCVACADITTRPTTLSASYRNEK
jgi:hypothetical protein